MKFLYQESLQNGTIRDVYQKRWRGHRVLVLCDYAFSQDPHWDGDEPLEPGLECYDTDVTVKFSGHEVQHSLSNSWIDPMTEGRRGSNYLFTVACDLLDECLHDLGVKLAQSGHVCKNKICIVHSVHAA